MADPYQQHLTNEPTTPVTYIQRKPLHSYPNLPPSQDTHFMIGQEQPDSSSDYVSVEEVKKGSSASYVGSFMGWWVEVAGLIASVVLFVAIVVLLKTYNGKLQPKWQYDFNLNALVALLATFLRITMMDVVTTLMGQLKWNWFSKPSKLSNLEAIDNGTRGPWAAFTLVFTLHRPHPILLGGAITVLSLALGLFTQQSVTAVPCVIPVANVNASIPIRRTVPTADTYRIGAGLFELDSGAKSTFLAGLTGITPEVPVGCQTGNCTFPSYGGVAYSSIGLCSQCVDTSSKISQVETSFSVWNFTLPAPDNGTIFGQGGGSDATYIDIKYGVGSIEQPGIPPWMVELDSTLAALNVSMLAYVNVISFTGVGCAVNKTRDPVSGYGTTTLTCPRDRPDLSGLPETLSVVGTGCVLYGCIKNYEANVTNGALQERVVSDIPAPRSDMSMPDVVGVNLPCIIDGKSYDLSNMSMIGPEYPRYIYGPENPSPLNNTVPEQCVYSMDWAYTRGVTAYLGEILTGSGLYNSRQGEMNGMPKLQFWDNWWLSRLYNNGLATSDSISVVFEDLVTAFTNYQRIPHPEFAETYDNANMTAKWSPSQILGLVQTTEICNQFNWQWLLFPASLLVATTILFITTVIVRRLDQRDLPVWKTSLLPLLFYGLDHGGLESSGEYRGSDTDSGDRSHQLMGIQELTKIADKTTVRFRRTAQGGNFEEIGRPVVI